WPGVSAVAGFPDLHPGRFGPVGAAFLAERIYPQLIGPDIGCGMALFRLGLDRRKLKIDKAARRLRVLEEGADPDAARTALSEAGLAGLMSPQGLGTIGGGNHFCEVQAVHEVVDSAAAAQHGLSKGALCLLVHSGSRGGGAQIFHGVDDSWKEGFAPDGEAGRAYITLHDAAAGWARLNRSLIAAAAARALGGEAECVADVAHNLLSPHGGQWLHRKGAAASAPLVPLAGSRETLSYLLAGGQAPATALGSLSHGAGRRYDRASMHGRVRKTKSSLAALQKNAFGGQVICESRDLLIEEAGAAYKDATQVAKTLEAFGLARPILSLAPLLTFKTVRAGSPR
ncbi:MAG: RtcB family protein, partial [Pseudomonadota bacterium]